MPICKICSTEKPLDEYYKGVWSRCKECHKAAITENRWNNIDRFRAYDRARGARQEPQYMRDYRKKYPNKYAAQTMVNNAVRDKKLFKKPCEVCKAEKTVGHHDDYLEPLNVRWLCQAHHKQWHRDNGEGLNG
jgi:hypothetical protein